MNIDLVKINQQSWLKSYIPKVELKPEIKFSRGFVRQNSRRDGGDMDFQRTKNTHKIDEEQKLDLYV